MQRRGTRSTCSTSCSSQPSPLGPNGSVACMPTRLLLCLDNHSTGASSIHRRKSPSQSRWCHIGETLQRQGKSLVGFHLLPCTTRNPSLTGAGRWNEFYWPLHSPLKRDILILSADSRSILHGHRVRKCAFWKKFLPQLGILYSETDNHPR